ncbi:multicopper oxidase domain-containing protein [Hyphobacterium sp. CCMP332]|nr:multicopper oxidase domain-containing protein [Hyphobacterium sp. CCMP332]
MSKRYWYLLVFTLLLFKAEAEVKSSKLYINRGEISFHPLGFNAFSFLAFNSSDTFSPKNDFIELLPEDTLELTILNQDTAQHNIVIDGLSLSTGIIQAFDSVVLSIQSDTNRIITFFDSQEKHRLLGLKSFIKVWDDPTNYFIWNLNELQSDFNLAIGNGLGVDIDSFNPDYFTINDQTHPKISQDSLAKVVGNVGDTIYIFVINSGFMYHAIHFHGYHVDILQSSKSPELVGRKKDSIPIKSAEYQVYLLIPHQEGKYPVHDHNLVATTGGGNYPNGMMVMMDIDP